MSKNYRDIDIIKYAQEVKSLAGLLKKLGLVPAGGNYDNMRRNIQRLNVDTSHWAGQGWTKEHQEKNWSEYTGYDSLKKIL